MTWETRAALFTVALLALVASTRPRADERGFITREIVAGFMPTLTNVRVMLCGPPPMMMAMRGIVVGLGVLSAADRQRGFILACQAHALRDVEVSA